MSDEPTTGPPTGPIERVDARDFLDPTARAVAYLDLDEVDGARAALAQMSLPRLRRLGEHYDRLSMMCFELASPAERTADLSLVEAAERTAERLSAAYRHDADLADRPVASPAPHEITFEVDDLDDLGHADTTERNPS